MPKRARARSTKSKTRKPKPSSGAVIERAEKAARKAAEQAARKAARKVTSSLRDLERRLDDLRREQRRLEKRIDARGRALGTAESGAVPGPSPLPPLRWGAPLGPVVSIEVPLESDDPAAPLWAAVSAHLPETITAVGDDGRLVRYRYSAVGSTPQAPRYRRLADAGPGFGPGSGPESEAGGGFSG